MAEPAAISSVLSSYLAYSAPFGGQGMYEYLKVCFEVLIHALHIARAMINIITDLCAKGNEP